MQSLSIINILKMKIRLIIYFIILIPLDLLSQFKAVHIPTEMLNSIKIDGEIDDWDWVKEEYIIKSNQLNNVFSNLKEADSNDLNCRLIVAWNEIKNWLYIVAYIEDDESHPDLVKDGKDYFSENLQFCINPNRYYYKESNTRIYGMCYIPTDLTNGIIEIKNGPKWLTKDNNYLKWSFKFVDRGVEKKTVFIYELGMQLWNTFSPEYVNYSEKVFLHNNQVIKLSIGFGETESDSKTFLVTADKPTDKKWYKQTEQLADFVLIEPEGDHVSKLLDKCSDYIINDE